MPNPAHPPWYSLFYLLKEGDVICFFNYSTTLEQNKYRRNNSSPNSSHQRLHVMTLHFFLQAMVAFISQTWSHGKVLIADCIIVRYQASKFSKY
uniref:Uncharacterized protein n=1 Tax=Rhizophora mucronata TaxID=61149 RepID=A0A2P2LMH7_RHIMU